MSEVAERVTADPVLRRYRDALDEVFGTRLARAVLFGSRARGEAHAESDYDVAVFLTEMPDREADWDRLVPLQMRFLMEDEAFFDAQPYRVTTYEERTPLMWEVRKDGVDL